MDDLNYIKKELKSFIRKYYLNELLKGIILFFSIWLLYFITLLLIEHFFWLSPPFRSILFWGCILVSIGLFYKFVGIPVARLFHLSAGLDEFEASRIIGKHFPEVGDKLINVLQLQNNPQQSDLLLASISQKSRELKPVPFRMAVNLRSNLKYLKYAAFPVLIILAVILTGNATVFSESYSRMIHYNTAFEPPAPFSFYIDTGELVVEEGGSLTLQVETQGNIVPQTASIHFDNEMYYLKTETGGKFQYTFHGIKENKEFYFSANGVRSKKYDLKVIKVPKLLDFEMQLDFPGYLQKSSETITGTGNVTVPEGTEITWKLRTRSTGEVLYAAPDTVQSFTRIGDNFSFSKRLYSNTDYNIKTSNDEVKFYEQLEYRITAIRDEYPEITVEQGRDSIRDENLYFFGKASDDHAISRVNLVYYIENEEDKAITVPIVINKEILSEFFYSFPGNLDLDKGQNYTLYFEAFDNDGIRGPKRTKSSTYGYRIKSEAEQKEDQLNKQAESIQSLTRSLDQMEMSEKELEELSRLQKEKEQLNFNDRKKLDDFLERQKQQNQIMKNYSEKLKQSLEQQAPAQNEEFRNELDNRLERNEERLKENEALLEELQKYSEKISREELTEKLEKLSRQNTNEQKNLEQLLELTKRYYVQETTQKLASDLEKLGNKQEQLPGEEKNTPQEQQELNDAFKDFQEKMDDLEKENSGLKKPFEMERDEEKESDIQESQEDAQDNLEKGNQQDAGKEQKDAGKKMKEMSQQMKAMQMMAQGDQLNANIESLRQILDNLLIFSFNQESLLLEFRKMRPNNPGYAGKLKNQQVLKEHFQHIDDSLFSLAVNNPMITEKITTKLTDIEFDLNKSLERLAQNELPQGTASQQYVMTGANELALMLSDVLGNMQEMANPSMGRGNGDGKGMQLQDIIMSQEELNKMMGEGMSEGKGEGETKPGEEGQNQNGKGEGMDGEETQGALFEIYKQQQILKQQLENKLKELGLDKNNSGLIREMEQVEKEILEKGFNRQTLARMNRITHRLLELENAVHEQEEEEKRTATTNLEEFENTLQDQILKAKEFFRSTEILNRQALPLRQNYKAKVKEYFGSANN